MNKDVRGIKRYFGINVSDEVAGGDFSKLSEGELQDTKIIELIDFHKGIGSHEKARHKEIQFKRQSKKGAGGLSQDLISQVFGDSDEMQAVKIDEEKGWTLENTKFLGAAGSVDADDFMEWYENNEDGR